MAKTISVDDFLKRQAELEQERLAVIAHLEAEIKERQDLIAQLKGESPMPIKRPQKPPKPAPSTTTPSEATQEPEIKTTAELPNEAGDIATVPNEKRKTQRLEGISKPDGSEAHG
jgi:hypothetical protein